MQAPPKFAKAKLSPPHFEPQVKNSFASFIDPKLHPQMCGNCPPPTQKFCVSHVLRCYNKLTHKDHCFLLWPADTRGATENEGRSAQIERGLVPAQCCCARVSTRSALRSWVKTTNSSRVPRRNRAWSLKRANSTRPAERKKGVGGEERNHKVIFR